MLSPQQAWREAEEDLRATQQVLEEAKERLRDVESGIAMLQAKYKSCIAKKEELEMKCEQCQQRLDRADTVGGRTGFFLLLQETAGFQAKEHSAETPVPATSNSLRVMAILGWSWLARSQQHIRAGEAKLPHATAFLTSNRAKSIPVHPGQSA